MGELEQRIERLERSNRRWKRLTLGMGMSFLLFFLLLTGFGLSRIVLARRAYAEAERQRAVAEEARFEAKKAAGEAAKAEQKIEKMPAARLP